MGRVLRIEAGYESARGERLLLRNLLVRHSVSDRRRLDSEWGRSNEQNQGVCCGVSQRADRGGRREAGQRKRAVGSQGASRALLRTGVRVAWTHYGHDCVVVGTWPARL